MTYEKDRYLIKLRMIKIMRYLQICFLISLLTLLFPGLNGQELNKRIDVYSAYKPSLSDVYKIDIMPLLSDTFKRVMPQEYKITPRKIKGGGFELRPIKPAKLVAEPLTELYKSHLKLGIGNYWTPFMEFNSTSLRSRKYAYGLYLKHHSSQGKVKLGNEEKVFSGFSDNKIRLNGEKFFETAILSGRAGFSRDKVSLYGCNTSFDTVLDKKDIGQHFMAVDLGTNFKSTYTDSTHLNYNVDIDFLHFRDHENNYINKGKVTGKFDKKISNPILGLETSLWYLNRSDIFNNRSNFIFMFKPWVELSGEEWHFMAGLNFATDSRLHYYPNLLFKFKAADDYFIPYLGISGYLEINDYQNIALENPFMNLGIEASNTSHQSIVFLGFNSYPGKKMSFHAKGSFSDISNMYFFVNDYIGTLGNTFNIVTDDVKLIRLLGEAAYKHSERLNFFLKGNYYKYTMTYQDHPWHKPNFDVTFSAHYNLRNKIYVNADLFAVGKRYYKPFSTAISGQILPAYADMNLGIEYRYTKILSAFLRLNNITSTSYQHWHQYPAQRFNLLVGITYAL